MSVQVGLVALAGLLVVSCGGSMGSPMNPLPPFAMFVNVTALSPGSAAARAPRWEAKVTVGARDASGKGGVLEAATVIARDADGGVVAQGQSAAAATIRAGGEGAIPLELHGAPGAKPVGRLDCTATIRDVDGLTRRYEVFLNYESNFGDPPVAANLQVV